MGESRVQIVILQYLICGGVVIENLLLNLRYSPRTGIYDEENAMWATDNDVNCKQFNNEATNESRTEDSSSETSTDIEYEDVYKGQKII